jgi:predicted SnoaL-like aldol condensation-catalyzing enzyme
MEVAKELTILVSTGFDDPFGPFNVEFPAEDEMIWTREENGELVTVTQRRIYNIPKSPATKAVGLWRVTEVVFGNQVKTDEFTESEFQAVFVRWDNLLQEITSEGRRSGMWRIDAHRPVIDILYYDGSKPLQYWDLDFENVDSMTWKRGGMMISFERLTSFPED